MKRVFTHAIGLPLQAICRLVPCVALAVLATGCQFPFFSRDDVPFDIKSIIPREWVPISKLIEINIDDDQAAEWLLFYRYDMSQTRKDKGTFAGPIGGVIFDRQIDRDTGVTMLARHDLLPDIRAGKGQGFLGEERCDARIYRPAGDGAAVNLELAVFGYAYGPTSPAYLSIFRTRDDPDQGYRFEMLGYFHGDGGIRVEPASGDADAIQRVIVRTRLNERSLISKQSVYVRQESDEGIEYAPVPAENALEFTYGIPENPYYPEAAVLAYYQLMNAGQNAEAVKFLLPEEERAAYQERVRSVEPSTSAPSGPAWPGGTVSALSLAYTGASEILPGETQAPFYYTTVTAEESTGATKVWEVIGLLDGRCSAEVCWQLMSWH